MEYPQTDDLICFEDKNNIISHIQVIIKKIIYNNITRIIIILL
jgi:hypothetical protein